MGIGSKIQILLDRKNMKAGTLASAVGISRNTLYSIIKRDNGNVNLSVLESIASELGVTIDYFFNEYEIDNIDNWSSPLTTAYAAAVRPTQDAVCAVLGIDYVDPKKSTPAESVTKVTPLQPSKPQPERDNSFFIAARTADGKPIKLPTEAPEGLDEFLADALARSNPPEDL